MYEEKFTVKLYWKCLKRLIEEDCDGVGTVLNIGRCHWVGIYVSKKSQTIEYYDPYGSEPSERVRSVLERIGRMVGTNINEFGGRFPLEVSLAHHQHDVTECGLYSLAFLYERGVTGKSFFACTRGSRIGRSMLDIYCRMWFA